MQLRIATFNMENLFTRPTAMADDMGEEGQHAITDQAELNRIIGKLVYSDGDKQRLIEIEKRYHFAALSPPSNALVQLNKIRGQLYSKSQAGVVTIKADGREDWTGWFQLKTTDINWSATYNTGRVIAEVNPDILICIEVENRPTLNRFNEQVLKAIFKVGFPHAMLIDGNDERGIDVGILSRHSLNGVRSHVDDRGTNGERVFSRDCPEYVVLLPNGKSLVVIPNHFKSKRGGNNQSAQDKRLAQATRAHEIAKEALNISPLVLLGGDLNDTPDSIQLAPLWENGFSDVEEHASYPKERPGTFGTGTASNKIDYLIMSPALKKCLKKTGIERRGSYHPNSWTPFDTVKSKKDDASDHHLVWADFEFN